MDAVPISHFVLSPYSHTKTDLFNSFVNITFTVQYFRSVV